MNTHFIVFILLSVAYLTVRAEVFTAIVELQKLLETEKYVAKLLDDYLAVEEKRIAQLKIFRDNYQRVHRVAAGDSEKYLANPVNAYLLVKRLTIDWETINNLVTVTPSKTANEAFSNLTKSIDIANSFPSVEDLIGAADALIRLQDTYKLDTSTMARGHVSINSPEYNRVSEPESINDNIELSAGDCFELGRHSYTIGDFYHTTLWMKEAEKRLERETIKTADEGEILEYLAFCIYKDGNTHQALEYTEMLLKLQPENERAIGNRNFFQRALNSSIKGTIDTASENLKNTLKLIRTEDYEALCRGERLLSPVIYSQLKCYHMNTKHIPYLRYTRVKVEEAYKKPQILMYHDFISDSEIEVMKKLAEPRLTRSTVLNVTTGVGVPTNFRIGKTAWLKDTDDKLIERVTKRAELITGLTSESAEDTQVVNYGIGGHYEAHYDFSGLNETTSPHNLLNGNRVSTWLNYLSDVQAGGATVFPDLKISLWPRKGSAAYWRNLHRDGTGDYLTRHAACPVLLGSKWIANKWFHERGQELTMPCLLTPDSVQ